MSVLRANLRLLWQRPSLWTLYGVILGLVGFGALFGWMLKLPADTLFMVLLMGVLPISQIVAVTQVETLSCPFSLTLPGHQRIVRQVVFLVGLIVSLGVTLIVPPYSLTTGHPILETWSTFSASLAVYFIGVGLTYVFALPGLTILIWVVLGLMLFWSISETAAGIILNFPIPTILTGFLGAAIVWLRLGRSPRRLRTGASTRGWLVGQSNRDRAGDGRYDASACGRFMLGQMRATGGSGAAKYTWGTLYAWSAPGGVGRRQLALTSAVALAYAALSWYLPPAGYLLVALISSRDFSKSPLYSESLVAGGRWERFLATLTLLVLAGGVWTISIVLSFAAIDLVQPYLPQFLTEFRDFEGGIPPMSIRFAIYVTVFYPAWALTNLAFAGRRSKGVTVETVLLMLVLLPAIILIEWRRIDIPVAWAALATVISWAVCVYGLYRLTMRRDLVLPRPEKEAWE